MSVISSAAAFAGRPGFGLPVGCDYGSVCFFTGVCIQARDPADGYTDTFVVCAPTMACGNRYKGTTVAERDRKILAILAADGGAGTRDDMNDGYFDLVRLETIGEREAGNVAVSHHEKRWITRYSHHNKDSLFVEKSQEAETAMAQQYRYVGKRGGPWADRLYERIYRLFLKDEADVFQVIEEERVLLTLTD